MFFALCRCEVFLPEGRSLKAKRSVMNRIKDRLRTRFRASVAEVATQDLHQRGTFGIALAGMRPGPLQEGLAAMRLLIEDDPRCQVVVWETRIASWADEPAGGAGADRDRAGEEPGADWDAREPDDECFGPLWDAGCGKDA